MSAGAIPVFVGRDMVPPFREQFDWPSFSFWFAPDQVGPAMVATLRAVPQAQLEKMQVGCLQKAKKKRVFVCVFRPAMRCDLCTFFPFRGRFFSRRRGGTGRCCVFPPFLPRYCRSLISHPPYSDVTTCCTTSLWLTCNVLLGQEVLFSILRERD